MAASALKSCQQQSKVSLPGSGNVCVSFYFVLFLRLDLTLKLSWPLTHKNPPASASWVLVSQAWVTTPRVYFYLVSIISFAHLDVTFQDSRISSYSSVHVEDYVITGMLHKWLNEQMCQSINQSSNKPRMYLLLCFSHFVMKLLTYVAALLVCSCSPQTWRGPWCWYACGLYSCGFFLMHLWQSKAGTVSTNIFFVNLPWFVMVFELSDLQLARSLYEVHRCLFLDSSLRSFFWKTQYLFTGPLLVADPLARVPHLGIWPLVVWGGRWCDQQCLRSRALLQKLQYAQNPHLDLPKSADSDSRTLRHQQVQCCLHGPCAFSGRLQSCVVHA